MKTLDRIAASEFIQDAYESNGAASFFLGIFGIIIGMIVAAILDINTGLPFVVWGGAWAGTAILCAMIPLLAKVKGFHKMHHRNCARYLQYTELSKAEKKFFPKNVRGLLSLNDNKIEWDFDKAIEHIESIRTVNGMSVEDAREAIAATVQSLEITRKTYDEYR